MNITLQIPFEKYGTLATLAAAANMPIDKYIVDMSQPSKDEQKAKQNHEKAAV